MTRRNRIRVNWIIQNEDDFIESIPQQSDAKSSRNSSKRTSPLYSEPADALPASSGDYCFFFVLISFIFFYRPVQLNSIFFFDFQRLPPDPVGWKTSRGRCLNLRRCRRRPVLRNFLKMGEKCLKNERCHVRFVGCSPNGGRFSSQNWWGSTFFFGGGAFHYYVTFCWFSSFIGFN